MYSGKPFYSAGPDIGNAILLKRLILNPCVAAQIL